MQITTKQFATACGSFILVLLLSVGYMSFRLNSSEKRAIALQNQMAEKDKTIEVQKEVFEKLTVQSTNLQGLLDKSSSEQKSLQDEISRQKGQVLQVTTASIQIQKAYEADALAKESEVPAAPGADPSAPIRKRVDFDKDFGYFGVAGYTLTDPASAWVSVKQNRALKIAVGVFQGADKSWKTVITSSEPDVQIDVGTTAVNLQIFDPRWYEKISFRGDLGGGSGGLAGVSAQYQFGSFEFGPSVWITATDHVDKFFGCSLTWHPFQRN